MVDEMADVKRRVEALEIENALLREVVRYEPNPGGLRKGALLTVTGDLVVTGKTELNGVTTRCPETFLDFDLSGPDLLIHGKLEVRDSATFVHPVECQETLTVQGATTLVGGTKVQDIKVERDLAVYGSTELFENLTCNRTADFKGHTRMDSATVASNASQLDAGTAPKAGELKVENATVLLGPLSVKKDVDFASDTTLCGNVVAKSAVNVEGELTAEVTSVFKGEVTQKSSVTAEKNVTVKGNTTVQGATTLVGDLKVQSATELQGNTSIKGNMDVDGKSDMGDTVLFHNGYM
jgi:cytoskeletal protein CcmA (bactofilin family)